MMFRLEQLETQDESFNLSQYFQDIIDCMPHLVYILDKDCTLVGCNNNMLAMLGITDISQANGKLYKTLESSLHWSHERIELLKEKDIAVLVGGEQVATEDEAPIVGEDGEIIYFRSTRTPLFGKEHNVIGLVVILDDITAHKRLEEEVEGLKEQLQVQKKVNAAITPGIVREAPPKVLLVEDNLLAQKASQALLLQLDCQVDVADSSDKVFALFKPGKYDIVFMDISLVDTSGYVVSKRIRQMEKETEYHVPIIALTGYEADVVKYDCDIYEMEGAITKPLSKEQAREIIEHYIYNVDVPIRGLKTSKDI
ncbi:response regulator [Legionella dresdenensis]|uniref:Response regulator n=1 Tax=Legionella dresdenensis TaxID=450200 RepID=A0ABV8CC87_9GAMM